MLNSILNTFVVLLKMAFGFILTKYVAINMGPTGVALFGQLQSLVSLFQNIPHGISNGVISNTAAVKDDATRPYWSWWFSSLQMCVIIYSLLLSSCFFYVEIAELIFKRSGFENYYLLLVLIYPLFHLYSLGNAMNTGLLKFKEYLTLNITAMIAYIVIILFYYYCYNEINVFLAAILFIPFCGVVVFVFTSIPYINSIKIQKIVEVEQLKSLFKYFSATALSVFLAPIVLMFIRNSLVDDFGLSAAGNWQAMWRVSEIYTGVITLGLSALVLPKFARADSYDKVIQVFKEVLYFAVPVLVFGAFIIYFGKEIWLPLLFSDEFHIPDEFFWFQLPGDILKTGCWLISYLILSKRKLKLYAFLEVTFSLLFALLAVVAIDLCGIIGVPAAFFINQLLCLIILTWWFSFVFKNE
tara:strand:+ start:13265 stop:14500 length:1236 start_codon:yes stop_codon:yes gene_type:complete